MRLKEATPLTGGLLLEMLTEPERADPDAPRPRLGMRGRGGPPGRGGAPGRGGPPMGGPRAGAPGPAKRGGPPKGVRKGKRT